MANPVWPTSLPPPDYGYTESEVDSHIVRSGSDAGIAKQRLRYTAVAVPVTCSITLSRSQLATFRTFVEDTLKYVMPFDWTDHLTDSGTVTFRFTKKPSYSRVSFDQVLVTMSLERMPGTYAPPTSGGGPGTVETLPSCSVAPAITGQLYVGQTLTCSSGTWSGNPTPLLSYQWQRWTGAAWANIVGAEGNTHVPTEVNQFRCLVTGSNSQGSVAAASNAVTVQAPLAAPACTVNPEITGSAYAGSVLTCTQGTWTGNPNPSYSYQWQYFVNGAWSNIANATQSTYTTADLADHRCRVTGSNTQGSTSAVSNVITVVPPLSAPQMLSSPTISGTQTNGAYYEGVVLTCSSGSWSGNPAPDISYLWEWLVNGSWEPLGETSNSLTTPQEGFYRCQVTAENSQGSSSTHTSSVEVLDTPVAPQNTEAPTISGAGTTGTTLSCSPGTWTGTPSPELTYQWQILSGGNWTNIQDATSDSYTPTSLADHRCAVTGTNGAGSAVAYSNVINVVAPPNAPQATTDPHISGNAYSGSTIYAFRGEWNSSLALTYAYQWQVESTVDSGIWNNISGATSAEYDVAEAKPHRCVVSATDSNGTGQAISNVMRIQEMPAGSSLITKTFTGAASDNMNVTTYDTTLSYLDNPNVSVELLVIKQATNSVHGNNTAGSLQAVAPNNRTFPDRQRVSAIIHQTDTTSQIALVLRWLNYDNCIFAYFGGGGSTITQRVAGVQTTYSLGTTVADGDTISFEINEAGTVVEMKVNGVHTTHSTNGSPLTLSTTQPSGDKCGCGLWSATTGELSSFTQFEIEDFSGSVALPVLDYAPQIFGDPTVDSTLYSSYGVWFGVPEPTYDFLWQRWDSGTSTWVSASGTNNTSSYTPTTNGDYRCRVNATNSAGTTTSYSSPITVSGGGAAPSGNYSMAEVVFDETYGGMEPMISAVEFRATVGGAKIAGTPSASSESGRLAAAVAANDTNTDTYWQPIKGHSTAPWYRVTFDTPVAAIAQTMIQFPNIDGGVMVNGCPRSFRIRAYDTGLGDWTTVRTVVGESRWTPGTSRNYNT